ncbi:signal recognition particle-docking protein FtsY [Candidatus Pacearchaeota archaeon]|nr:signal recognition particle-docking protein FtsY [Candidatus Pacearchaeota archaeon]|tara:strand:+ start:3779 stop:5113 length:1335 start_codon:yes stop_codon:yes gene_type:complete
MFGKFKDKLKGWFKDSSEKIEEEAKVVETEKEKEKIKLEKEIKKAEKIIEESKEKKGQNVPSKFDAYNRKTIPDLEKIEEEAEGIKKQIDEAKKKQKQAEKEEEEVEKFDTELERVDKEEKEELKLPEDEEKSNTPDLEDRGKGEVKTENLSEEKKSFFSRMKSGFSYKITENEFNDIFDDLELLLLDNNVALDAVDDIKNNLEKKLVGREIKKEELENEIKNELKAAIEDILIEPDNPLEFIKIADKPFKILFFGINGTGKTTSIAKITSFLKNAGFSVVLAAGDTFRAASIEQIGEHADKLNVPLIKQDYGADPAAVGYDAIQYAKKNKIDVVLIDTAGRMHTKSNLMAEMEKIIRVTEPNLKVFVAESVAGNDAVDQAKAFHEAVDIDGIILSKADIDEKGGTIISVSHATGKPIFYLGTGQNYEDLELFNKQKFVDSLGL